MRTLLLCVALVACSSSREVPSAVLGSVACDPGRGGASLVSGFTRFVVDEAASGPSYTSVGDVDGDGRVDLVVSSFGPIVHDGANITLSRGHVDAYLQGDGLGCWKKVTLVGDDANLHFPNRTSLADLDGDGDLDLLVPSGFFVCTFDKAVRNCGGLAWFENAGGSWKRHDVVPPGDARFYHRALDVDFDGDGVKDLVTVAESSSGANARWFKGNSSPDRFDPTPHEIGDGGGSFPSVVDVDGDGDLDLLSAEYFVEGGSFAWFERTTGMVFERHVVSSASETGKGFQLELVPNLFGDGKLRAVGANHTNVTTDATAPESAVWVFDPTVNPRANWPKTRASTGIVSRPSEGTQVQGAPGVFGVGDIDGDGDLDLAVAGDGDPHTYWMEQKSGAFSMHVIEERLGQAASAQVVDLDRDGRPELVFTGYEDGKVFVYARAN
ncbi:MAG: FG-GAP-like repeat-containing protein [Polyangiales bacterium]